jgi:hypothetical protein
LNDQERGDQIREAVRVAEEERLWAALDQVRANQAEHSESCRRDEIHREAGTGERQETARTADDSEQRWELIDKVIGASPILGLIAPEVQNMTEAVHAAHNAMDLSVPGGMSGLEVQVCTLKIMSDAKLEEAGHRIRECLDEKRKHVNERGSISNGESRERGIGRR